MLKMFNLRPESKGVPCPEGCRVVRFSGDTDVPAWIDICKDGEQALIDRYSDGYAVFDRELIHIDGPDPYRDTWFVECGGKKIATFTAVPDMWSTGMGYIHMVACKQAYRGRGIGKFMADYALKILTDIGKERVFLLTSTGRLAALSVYIKAGFVAADDGRTPEESEEQLRLWQGVVNTLGLPSIDFLTFEGDYKTTIYPENVH